MRNRPRARRASVGWPHRVGSDSVRADDRGRNAMGWQGARTYGVGVGLCCNAHSHGPRGGRAIGICGLELAVVGALPGEDHCQHLWTHEGESASMSRRKSVIAVCLNVGWGRGGDIGASPLIFKRIAISLVGRCEVRIRARNAHKAAEKGFTSVATGASSTVTSEVPGSPS